VTEFVGEDFSCLPDGFVDLETANPRAQFHCAARSPRRVGGERPRLGFALDEVHRGGITQVVTEA
jgi:hypothetical protein